MTIRRRPGIAGRLRSSCLCLTCIYNRWLATKPTKPTEVPTNEPAGDLSEAMTEVEPQPERGTSTGSKDDAAKPVVTTAAKELVDDFEQRVRCVEGIP